MSDKNNLELWNSVCKTNPDHTKKVKQPGRQITAVDPYRQIMNATEKFGPVGKGWGWSVVKVEQLSTNEVGVLVRMWHEMPEMYFEQWGQSSLYMDRKEEMKDKDCFKKATTDGITKCLSFLGFNADIFLGKYDDNKYVQEMKKEFSEDPKEMTKEDRIQIRKNAKDNNINTGELGVFIQWVAEQNKCDKNSVEITKQLFLITDFKHWVDKYNTATGNLMSEDDMLAILAKAVETGSDAILGAMKEQDIQNLPTGYKAVKSLYEKFRELGG